MKAKIPHIIEEITEILPEETALEVQAKLEKIKELQADFFAQKEFQKKLKTRLEGVYSIENTPSKRIFSWFQYAGIVSSFIFVSCVSYFFYINQQQGIQNIPLPTIVEENALSSDEIVVPLESENIKIQDEEILGQGGKKTSSSLPQDTKEDISKNFNSESQKVKASPEDINILQDTFPASGDEIPMLKSSSFSETSTNSDENSIGDIQPFMMQSSVPMDELPSSDEYNDAIPEMGKTRMMDFTESDRFYELCASYSGTVLSDSMICQFGEGKTCTQESMLGENPELCEFLIQETYNPQIGE